jgi:hypothetical protein
MLRRELQRSGGSFRGEESRIGDQYFRYRNSMHRSLFARPQLCFNDARRFEARELHKVARQAKARKAIDHLHLGTNHLN